MTLGTWFITRFLACGFGTHFVHLLDQLRSFTQPSIACGWESGTVVKHVHVLVQKPPGGFFSSVSVEFPHVTFCDAFKRVSMIFFL